MLSVSMPNSATPSALVDTATKCFATAASSPPSPASAHALALCALVIVSSVVNVFDAMMKSVSAGSRSWVASHISTPSTLETKRKVMSRRAWSASASVAMRGPRSLPPMPTFTTLRIGLPVWPTQAPSRTRSANPAMRSSTEWTSGTTSWSPSRITLLRGARRATCSTARSSVTLMCSPANIASRSCSTPARRARAARSEIVSSVSRFFE